MDDHVRRRLGRVCLWSGAVGVGQALVLAVYPAQVGDERFSYPFTATGHAVAQSTFFLQHLGLLAGLVALCALPAAAASKSTRLGLRAGAAGMALLAVQELVAISAANEPADSGLGGLVNGLYSVPVLLIGFGMVVGGVGLARHTRATEPGWLRWVPAMIGAWVFVPMTPALMGGFLAGRAGIGSWMALFIPLGWGLARDSVPAWTPTVGCESRGRLVASAS